MGRWEWGMEAREPSKPRDITRGICKQHPWSTCRNGPYSNRVSGSRIIVLLSNVKSSCGACAVQIDYGISHKHRTILSA
jgi:hypothetical protein